MAISVQTNAAQEKFTAITDGSAKEQKARALCAALYVQAQLSTADAAAVQKYVTELDALV